MDGSEDAIILAGWITGGIGAASLAAFIGTSVAVTVTCDQPGKNAEGEDLEGRGCPAGSDGLLIGNAVTAGVAGAGLGVGAILLVVGYTRTPGSTAEGAIVSGPGDVGLGYRWRF